MLVDDGKGRGYKAAVTSENYMQVWGINQSIERILLKRLLPEGVQVLWQTGSTHYEYYRDLVDKNKIPHVVLKPYIDEMYKAYHAADLAVCRAGAMTLTEITFAGIAAILVPLPGAAGNHQYKNAESLSKREAAFIVEENDKMDENIVHTINTMIFNREELLKITERLRSMIKYDTMEKIIQSIDEILKTRYDQKFAVLN